MLWSTGLTALGLLVLVSPDKYFWEYPKAKRDNFPFYNHKLWSIILIFLEYSLSGIISIFFLIEGARDTFIYEENLFPIFV